jgi:hypothetical protein
MAALRPEKSTTTLVAEDELESEQQSLLLVQH